MNLSQNSADIVLCQECILPETFPGIKFDDRGVCNHCMKEKTTIAKAPTKKKEYRKRLDHLIQGTMQKKALYDVIMAYSGGKDSTYTMKLLKERYNLGILALTFDNHFISPSTWENIKRNTDTLKVDHMVFKPPWSSVKAMFSLTAKEDIFSDPTLLRASSICTACIGLVKSLVLKCALEMSIPLVAFGWSPGQAPIQSAIMKNNPSLTRANQIAFKKAFPPEINGTMDQYFIPENYYEIYKERFPHNIHPLAFFDYSEERIKKELHVLGWKPPLDTDTNSSNCMLNAFANNCHIERHGFHPYVWEIANMVRQGVMNRDEGIEKIYSPQNNEMVEYARERLV